ncbi:family 16 glycoside hydrolase [Chitinophaga vietnamensis]|uniref:family 16 glycoside hydrolase n=1 Tax=Chitinophaga vietnamensis TaxID=2593957 RepID=UPI00137586FB|nr:family 16 glycoside hydrolase [Chitinophaga vietnamensis]
MHRWNKFRPKLRACIPGTLVLLATLGNTNSLRAQNKLALTDLSAFRQPAANWRLAGAVSADLQQHNKLDITPGNGILVNLPDKGAHGQDLYTNFEHGDLDLELDYMMSYGSNSGIYLQGRYEVQLFDSWGATAPRASDNGGIYERWDNSRPEGQQGFDGHAPRQNASHAPGLWQHLKIAFQAPRFDASGNKISNATVLSIVLNGVTIQENVVLSGPTRGAMQNNEVPSGPLRIQGDHGTIAFRNIVVTNYTAPQPDIKNIQYSVYKGKFNKPPDFSTLKPAISGTSTQLTSNIPGLPANEFLVRYTGTLEIKKAGNYTFGLHTSGGGGMMSINNKELFKSRGWDGKGSIQLEAGSWPIEILYAKNTDWAKASLTLTAKEAAIREFLLSDPNVPADDPVDPIIVNATENTVLRSFMDLHGGPRVVHAVSVGSPAKVHYTYDLDNGMPVQVWRGDFLNTTPMWHDRGDGSSRPLGTVQQLTNKPALAIQQLNTTDAPWPKDTTGSGYRPKGYSLDAAGSPVFHYNIYGAAISDSLAVLPQSQGLYRTLTAQQPAEKLYLRIAVADSITQNGNLYVIGDKSYYIRIDDARDAVIRSQEGRQELLVPVKSKVGYAIIF